ncbi:hypothetical protein [Kingella pumchi]|jgi:hypothetical protein|uniref:Uncharacterized protein n=1 Tax=Kingella pumchi TaxID=2779506 RepID=A0ABS9NPG7_9NEIS|nr:hypothetical protein [Kingella pumchi]MCG6504696.1 hypothetical protein [Kingella pumchi]
MEGYGLEVGGRPPFLGVAMLADTLHIAGKSGEYVYPSDDERYGYFATYVYSDNHFGHTALHSGSGGGMVACTRAFSDGSKLIWRTFQVYAYAALGSVDTALIWRYCK